MGSFFGHIVPGIYVFFFGSWWMININRSFFWHKCTRNIENKYSNQATFRFFTNERCNIEGILKLMCGSTGFIRAAVKSFRGGEIKDFSNIQHMPMFGFAVINGLVDIILHSQKRKSLFPPKLDYAALALVFAMEGILFSWHLHARGDVDVEIHKFLIYTVMLTLIFTILEAANTECVLFAYGRAYSAHLHGSWFIQIGFSLYNPMGAPIPDNMQTQMLIPAIFAIHVTAILIVHLLSGYLIYRCVMRSRKSESGLYRPQLDDDPGSESEAENILLHQPNIL